MRKSKMTNSELLKAFELSCFQITLYPSNKAKWEEFRLLEKEIAKRFGITEKELEHIRDNT